MKRLAILGSTGSIGQSTLAVVAELKAAGVRLIDETPREGAHGALVAFLRPKAPCGLLVELCQYPD